MYIARPYTVRPSASWHNTVRNKKRCNDKEKKEKGNDKDKDKDKDNKTETITPLIRTLLV